MRLLTFVAVIAASIGTIHAQVAQYQSSAVSWYTFDINFNRTYPHTSFDWQYGRAPHVGRAQLNGVNQYIDLNEMPDDNGKLLPSTLPVSMSFEYWVMWNQLNSWSRILDCGNSNFTDNIILSNVEMTNDFRAAFYRGNAEQNQTALAAKSIFPNTWQHLVVTIAQKNASDSTSSKAAEINVYIDGALVYKNPSTYLLREVARTKCWIGKSDASASDGYFSGWIDDFFVYNYALSAEQVAVHYVLERVPVYELTFSTDPREIAKRVPDAPTTFTYAWQRFSPTDNSSVAQFHEGHLDLSGDQFIDLTATRRYRTASWVGTEVFPTIGGWAESGAQGTASRGWSIEIIGKFKLYERWAKVFDLGNGAGQDNVVLGFEGTTHNFQFETWTTFFDKTPNPMTNTSRLNDVLAPVVLNQWYQIIIVMVPYQNNPLIGSVKTYVDGKLTKQAENFNMPARKERDHCWIGKSNWAAAGDEYIDMELDAFRIYDTGLTAQEVVDLYDVTHAKIPDEETDVQRDFRYTSWPAQEYTFSARADQYLTDGTNFTWSEGTYPRLGLANFEGSRRHYANLQYFPTDKGSVLPRIGGSMTIEIWARWTSLRQWSRLIDLGGRQSTADNNLIIANVAATSTLAFEVYNGEVATSVHIPQAIRVGQWQHIVVVADQVRLGDTISPRSAQLRVYIDGVERASQLGYLPMQVNRPNSFIGRSNWPADDFFSGSIDAVYVYDYGLQYEQVAAHNLLPRPPVFELAFGKDPRPWINPDHVNDFTYMWEDIDPLDAGKNLTKIHRGMLVLDGDQYVNLTSWSGNGSPGLDSVGTGVPAILFNTSAYPPGGPNPSAASGWSIEIIFKLLRMENGAKIFDFSNGRAQDEVGIGFHGSDNTLDFFVYNPNFPDGRNFPVLEDPEINKWYHIMLTGRRTGGGTGIGVFTAYVNGVQTHEAQDFPFPRGIARKQCFLGKSPWDEDFIDMRLDTFRLYDFYVIPETVQRLYEVSEENLEAAPKPIYTSGPLNEWTFDVAPTAEQWNGGTKFTWQAGEGAHQGVAHFDGRTEFVNLFAFADDTGTPFPIVIGNGSFSFEWWAKFESLQSWSRLIDIGNAGQDNNILVANREATSIIEMHTYLGSQSTTLSTGTAAFVNLSSWHHIVVTLDDRTPYTSVSPTSNQASDQTIFVDGREVASARGYRPLAVERVYAYMGKSHWVSDALFRGSIDSFYYYDYALSGEQINVHRRLPRPPIFDLSFSYDPRVRMGGFASLYSYRWQEYDPSDTIGPDARYHAGHAVLSAPSRQFINLSTPVGYNSVGVMLPGIGGRSYGSGNTKEGWSFEFVIKIDSLGRNAKVIDWGNADGADNIMLGYAGNTDTLRFQVSNSRKGPRGTTASMDVIDHVELGKWYHIVISIEPTNYNNFDAKWKLYVDGYPYNTLPTGWLPRGIVRNSALIGKSSMVNETNSQVSLKIDAVRVYDYLVSESEAAILYSLVHDENAIPRPRLSSSSSSSSTGVSSTARSSSSSSSRRSSSSSSPRPVQKEWCDTYSSELDGIWPFCFCAEEFPFCDVDCLMYPDDDDCLTKSSSSTGGVVPSKSNSIGTAAVIGIVFAIIVGLSAVGYLYMRYCRSAPSSSQTNADGKTSLLGDTRIGVERENAYTQWVPPNGSVPMSSLPASHQSA